MMPHHDHAAAEEAAPGRMADQGDNRRVSPLQTDDLTAALQENERLRAALAAADEQARLLTDERQHRVRNMLATIRAIYRQSLASGADGEGFAQHFKGRLDAIARYQTYPGGRGTHGIELEDIIRDELLQLGCSDGARCKITGPPVRLWGKRAELMGLVIHELVTNAMKFGALGQQGTLAIEWAWMSQGVRLRWSETGVAMATPAPRPARFGRHVIEEALPYQFGATTSFDLKPGGLGCIIELPLPAGEMVRPTPQDSEDEPPLLPVKSDALP